MAYGYTKVRAKDGTYSTQLDADLTYIDSEGNEQVSPGSWSATGHASQDDADNAVADQLIPNISLLTTAEQDLRNS